MKTIEEKARAYDKVRKKIAIRFGSNVADEFFAEFEGPKDEEIRKALLEMVHDTTGDGLWACYNVHKEEALAWLEKQEGCEYIKKDWLEHIKQSWYKEGFIDGKYSGGTSKEWTINDAATLKELIDFLENGTAKLQHDLTRYANWLKNQFTPIEKQAEQKPNPVLDIEIPFGAKDSELQEATYYIPKGFHAEIDDDKVVIKQGEQKPADTVKPKFKVGEKELTNEELCEGLIRGMVNEHNRVTKEVLRNEYEKGRADVLAKIDAIDVDEMVYESGATSRVTQYWYAHGVNDVIKKLKEGKV